MKIFSRILKKAKKHEVPFFIEIFNDQVTVPAAKQVGLPHWPINCSYELAYDFFANVVHDFGKGFIMDFLRPYATEKLELNNIDTFVRDLLGE